VFLLVAVVMLRPAGRRGRDQAVVAWLSEQNPMISILSGDQVLGEIERGARD